MTVHILLAASAAAALSGPAGAQDLPDYGRLGESPSARGRSSPSPAPSAAERRARVPRRFVSGIDGTIQFTSRDANERTQWFDTTLDLDAGMVRIDVSWRSIATRRPDNPSDPADPAYDFSALDGAVTDATARHLGVMFTLFSAPGYGQEGGGEPQGSSLPAGSWKPKPAALGAFAKALATRYSGSFRGLPRVRDFEPWNEANLNGFMAPQYRGTTLVAPDRYRDLVIAVNDAINSVHPGNRVVVGSLAPYGDEPGSDRTRPLAFLRDLLCLNERLVKTGCPQKTPVDVLSHHPINTSGGPSRSAIDDDDVATPDLGNVERVLRAAEREGTIAGKRRHHPLWATEFWWATGDNPADPADADFGTHGRWVEQSLYLFWKAGAELAIYFTLIDDDADIGLYSRFGNPKPATTAFRFPFVTERYGKQTVFAWGKSPRSGTLTIEEETAGGWRAIHSEDVTAGKVFTADLNIEGRATLRATIGGDESLTWTQKG